MRIICIVVVMLLTMVSAAIAQDTYSYRFYYNAGSKVGLESYSDSTQGLDQNDVPIAPYVFKSTDAGLTIYKQNGKDGWDSASAFYVRDARSSLAAGQTEVFNDIYLWAGRDVTLSSLQIKMDSFYMSPGMTYSLDLISTPTGVSYNGQTHWGASYTPITLPFFSTDDPTKGYRFRATITAPASVPEPSSVLSLSAVLVTMAGFGLRRRSG